MEGRYSGSHTKTLALWVGDTPDTPAIPRPPEKAIHQGEYLDLQDISREQMGAYLCIARSVIPGQT